MDAVLQILREFGFPIFVCLWFMNRLEKRLDRLVEVQAKLVTVCMVLVKAMDLPEVESVKIAGLLESKEKT
jgi:hypothetical protein